MLSSIGSGLVVTVAFAVPLTVVGWIMAFVLRRPLRLRWAGGATIIGAGAGIYWASRDMRPARLAAASAHSHARSLLGFEHAIGLGGFEASINRWTVAHHLAGTIFADFYGTAHLFVSAMLLCWIGAMGHRSWRWALPALGALFLTALVVFIIFPVAPPWTMPGFHGLAGGVESGSAPAALEYAAFPSLHVGFAVWAALVGRQVWPRLRHAVWLYPAFVTFVVIATGNHYLVDAAGGAALAVAFSLASMAICRRIPARATADPATLGDLTPIVTGSTDAAPELAR